MDFRGVNMVMAVVGFAMSTTFISFICIRLIVARIQLAVSRENFPISDLGNHNSLESGFRGLDPRLVANFPTKKHNDANFASSDDSQCVVCLAEYHKEDTLRILPHCGHFFHILCIDKWLHQHSTCPICRISLRQFPDKIRMPPMYSSSISPHHHAEFLDIDPYCCLSATQDRRMRGNNDHRLGNIRDNSLPLERRGEESRERINIVIDGSRNKHEESPSNT